MLEIKIPERIQVKWGFAHGAEAAGERGARIIAYRVAPEVFAKLIKLQWPDGKILLNPDAFVAPIGCISVAERLKLTGLNVEVANA